MPNRTIEAYVGEYASGKSENAVNRALFLASCGHAVTLVDLDLVEPCFCLRPLRETVEKAGVTLLAFATEDTFGLGEAGQTILPAARFALMRQGDIILDIGYGIEGSKILNLLVGAEEDPDLQVILVVNTGRPMTDTAEKIISYAQSLQRVDGILLNNHLAEETTEEFLLQGVKIGEKAAAALHVPIVGVSVAAEILPQCSKVKQLPYEIRPLQRVMPNAFW